MEWKLKLLKSGTQPFPGRSGMNFRVILLVLLGALQLGSLHAQEVQGPATSALTYETSVPRKWNGEWRFLLGGITHEEGKDEGGAAALYVNSRFNYRLAPWLNARISPAIRFFSSRVQERFDDDTYQSGMFLTEGFLSVEPVSFFEARAGALNQGHHGTSMLVSGLRSFPGVQEIFKTKFADIEGSVIFQQAVATSHTLNTEREREEKMPSFNTETVALTGKNFGWMKWSTTAGHYAWTNVPAKVVYESRRLGNTGFGENVPSNGFLNGHEGFFGTAELCYCTDDAVNFVFEFQRIHNTSAASNAADAQLWGLGPNFNFGESVLDIRYRRYFIESDATVAYYNKSRMGHTNRIGHNIEATWHFKKNDFSIVAEAYFAEPINRDPNQRDLTVIFIGVETDYAKF